MGLFGFRDLALPDQPMGDSGKSGRTDTRITVMEISASRRIVRSGGIYMGIYTSQPQVATIAFKFVSHFLHSPGEKFHLPSIWLLPCDTTTLDTCVSSFTVLLCTGHT